MIVIDKVADDGGVRVRFDRSRCFFFFVLFFVYLCNTFYGPQRAIPSMMRRSFLFFSTEQTWTGKP